MLFMEIPFSHFDTRFSFCILRPSIQTVFHVRYPFVLLFFGLHFFFFSMKGSDEVYSRGDIRMKFYRAADHFQLISVFQLILLDHEKKGDADGVVLEYFCLLKFIDSQNLIEETFFQLMLQLDFESEPRNSFIYDKLLLLLIEILAQDIKFFIFLENDQLS